MINQTPAKYFLLTDNVKFNPEQHHRRSIRLTGYDYSWPGTYFVTICVQNRGCIFGEIEKGRIVLSKAGQIIRDCWEDIPNLFPFVELGEFTVMPNHFHGIVSIQENTGLEGRCLINQTPVGTNDRWILQKNPKPVLGKMVRSFKAKTAKLIHDAGFPAFQWQKNYYEHIIRGEKSLTRIRQYISDNPLRWEFDRDNPNGQPDQTEQELWLEIGWK